MSESKIAWTMCFMLSLIVGLVLYWCAGFEITVVFFLAAIDFRLYYSWRDKKC